MLERRVPLVAHPDVGPHVTVVFDGHGHIHRVLIKEARRVAARHGIGHARHLPSTTGHLTRHLAGRAALACDRLHICGHLREVLCVDRDVQRVDLLKVEDQLVVWRDVIAVSLGVPALGALDLAGVGVAPDVHE